MIALDMGRFVCIDPSSSLSEGSILGDKYQSESS